MDNRLLRFARLALAVAEQVVPDHVSKFAPRPYRPPQLLACLLLKEHLGLDYRTVAEILHASDGLRSSLGLARVPDHSTLWWHACHRVGPELLGAALAETVRRIEPTPEPPRVALDSTGLWLSYTSWYFAWRARRNRGQRSRAALATAEVGVGALDRAPRPPGTARPAGAVRRVFRPGTVGCRGLRRAAVRPARGRRGLRQRGQPPLLPRGRAQRARRAPTA